MLQKASSRILVVRHANNLISDHNLNVEYVHKLFVM